jgi:flagellar biosynthesis protein FlhF
MRVKTFTGSSAAAVMAAIKKELGPEAVILSNQTRRENGKTVCEIMAAVEPEADQGPEPGEACQAPGCAPAGSFEREWSEMKDHLNALLKPHMNLDVLPSRQKLAMRYLEREGVEESILMGLYRSLTAGRGASLLTELGKVAKVKPLAQFHEKFQILAGPSGSGKTSALVRMAMAAKRAEPGRRMAVVNCDARGAGGKAILKRLAEISDLTYADAADPEDFSRILLACRNFDVIFVDAPALEPGQTLAAWLGERSLAIRDDTAVHLALPPYFSPAHYQGVMERHRSPLVKSIIWTKLDEACSFGSLINVARSSGLPVSAFVSAPGVTGGLAEATSQSLWRLVFSHHLPEAGAQPAMKTVEKAA